MCRVTTLFFKTSMCGLPVRCLGFFASIFAVKLALVVSETLTAIGKAPMSAIGLFC